jgi:hypothetical protein
VADKGRGDRKRRDKRCPRCRKKITTDKSRRVGICSRCRKADKIRASVEVVVVDPVAMTPPLNGTEAPSVMLERMAQHITRHGGAMGDDERRIYEWLDGKKLLVEAYLDGMMVVRAGRLSKMVTLVAGVEDELLKPERLEGMTSLELLRTAQILHDQIDSALVFIRTSVDRTAPVWMENTRQKLLEAQPAHRAAKTLDAEQRQSLRSLLGALGQKLDELGPNALAGGKE